MSSGKGSFIEEMKKRLNGYHMERLQRLEQKEANRDLFQQETEAKDVLIQMGDASEILEEDQFCRYDAISGWPSRKSHQPPTNPHERKTLPLKMPIQPLPSRTIATTDNYVVRPRDPSMITHLKELLLRLQSPESKKRELRSENKSRNQQNKNKMKTQETMRQMRKEKAVVDTEPVKRPGCLSQGRPERARFQTIDLNSENSRPALQSARPNVDYQKIRRKSQNQYDIEIAHEKDILQQLIKGTNRGNQNYFSNRSQKANERFTLKNLLC